MPDYRANYTFENWAHTKKFKPDRFCQPATEAAVIDIVKDALANGGNVRTCGGRHSWSDFVVTDDTLVQLDDLDPGLIADIPNRRYTVQAGIRLKDLIENLVSDGLTLKNLGSITEQSIAGAISTGTHGTGPVRHSRNFGVPPEARSAVHIPSFELIAKGEDSHLVSRTRQPTMRAGKSPIIVAR